MKKTITIIIIIFLILLGGIGYYLYINSGDQGINSGKIFDSVKNFFPFGAPSAPSDQTNQNTSSSTNQNTKTQPVKTDRLFQISETPTAGFVAIDTISTSTEIFFNKEKNATTSTSTKLTETFVRFVERATGNVLESKISNLEKSRISNATIPKVYEAFLNSKGTELIVRTLSGETITTEYRKINVGTSTATSSQTILYPFNTDIFIARGDSVFYTVRTALGSTGYIGTFDNKKPTQIFSTPLRDIGASWSGGNAIEIFNKPNSQYVGISFAIDIKKKTIKESLSGILGLTTNPNMDGSYTLYNTSIENLDLGSKKGNTNTALYLTTNALPEKCIWSKKNIKIAYCAVPNYFVKTEYPEKWYQGLVSFADDFWSINVETGEQKLVYRPSSENKPLQDVTNLSLNDKENYLFFINKNDLSLWGLAI